ncbi:MAG: acyl carrier protein [Gammaproteobacteria bacterium]|nr:acyl carrier protein [Gammaproteobacteria bacterium]
MSMSRDDVRKALIDCILAVAPEADFSNVRPDRPLRDQLDIDSFDFLTILQHLHERIGVDVPESDYGKMITLDGSVDYLMHRPTRPPGAATP